MSPVCRYSSARNTSAAPTSSTAPRSTRHLERALQDPQRRVVALRHDERAHRVVARPARRRADRQVEAVERALGQLGHRTGRLAGHPHLRRDRPEHGLVVLLAGVDAAPQALDDARRARPRRRIDPRDVDERRLRGRAQVRAVGERLDVLLQQRRPRRRRGRSGRAARRAASSRGSAGPGRARRPSPRAGGRSPRRAPSRGTRPRRGRAERRRGCAAAAARRARAAGRAWRRPRRRGRTPAGRRRRAARTPTGRRPAGSAAAARRPARATRPPGRAAARRARGRASAPAGPSPA